jgi:hypothetical protein
VLIILYRQPFAVDLDDLSRRGVVHCVGQDAAFLKQGAAEVFVLR